MRRRLLPPRAWAKLTQAMPLSPSTLDCEGTVMDPDTGEVFRGDAEEVSMLAAFRVAYNNRAMTRAYQFEDYDIFRKKARR